jgi:hypothetical protein
VIGGGSHFESQSGPASFDEVQSKLPVFKPLIDEADIPDIAETQKPAVKKVSRKKKTDSTQENKSEPEGGDAVQMELPL